VPEPIKVDPRDVAQAADRISGCAEQLAAGHTSAHSAADAARSGFVGQSADAIISTMDRWQATTAKLHGTLGSQGDALKSAAAAYARTEDDSRDMIVSLNPLNP
jgi:WXG100 family type VII secretion target